MRIPRVVSCFVLGAFITGARGVSAGDKSDLPKPSGDIVKKAEPPSDGQKKAKTKFTVDEKLINSLGSESFEIRQRASSELSAMPHNIDFLVYLLDEIAKPHPLEISSRLQLVQKKVLQSLEQAAVDQTTEPSKRLEIPLELINIMNEKRSTLVWSRLLSSVMWIKVNEPVPNQAFEHNGYSDIQFPNRKLTDPLGTLLLSPFDKDSKDSKELKAKAEEVIVSLAGYREYDMLISLHNIKLKRLAELSELGEMENGLKEFRKFYLRLGLSQEIESRAAYSARAYIQKILEKSIEAYSTDDPKKQAIGINNINLLKKNNELGYLRIEELVRPKNTASVFKRKEFSGYVTSVEELLSFMKIAHFAELNINDPGYYTGYSGWISKQIYNPELQRLPDREEIKNILEHEPVGRLSSLAKNNGFYEAKAEAVSPLVQTYANLVKKYGSDPEFLKKNWKHIIDFQYFSHFYLKNPEREKLHRDLLALFDNLAESINNIKDLKEKAYFRTQLVTALPLVSSYSSYGLDEFAKRANKFAQKAAEDYIVRLSDFYFKGQKNLNTEEFMQLTDSLFFHDSQGVGKDFPPEIMLGFIRHNFQHLEKNMMGIIEAYKKSNVPAVKAVSREQLQKLYSSFHHLFRERRKAEIDNGWLLQYYQKAEIINTAPATSFNLKYYPEWREQISEIERWFQRFERPITEIISVKNK